MIKSLSPLPGVPNEMKHLLQATKSSTCCPKEILSNIGSSALPAKAKPYWPEMIKDIEASLPPDIKLAYLPHFSQVTLRLTSYGADNKELLDDFAEQISQQGLANLFLELVIPIFQKQLVNCYRERKETIGTAESCTGGYVSHLITSVPGSSEYYLGSVIPYAYELKTSLLDISTDMLNTYGAVSEEVITAMAEGVRNKLGVTWAIATSGIAGPGGATPQKPVGTIWIACAGPNGTRSRLLKLTRDRMSNIEYSAIASLVLLRKMMMEKR